MRRATPLLLAVVLVAGCGGAAKIQKDSLSRLVLTDADLAKPFSAFYNGAQTKLDVTSSARADPTRFGREGGWIARFTRPGTKATPGPLVVVSRADLFGSSKGAKDDLGTYRFELARQVGIARQTLRPPQIGDETIGLSFRQPGSLRVRFVTIAWRYRNATASLTAQGFANRLSVPEVVRLARRQQQHLAAAS